MTTNNNLLETALRYTVNAHHGRYIKTGEPLIFQTLRAMHAVETVDEKMVALLYDLVADSEAYYQDLRDIGILEPILDILRLLYHHNDLSLPENITAIAQHPVAHRVKLAYLHEFVNLPAGNERDIQRKETYKKAIALLESNKTTIPPGK